MAEKAITSPGMAPMKGPTSGMKLATPMVRPSAAAEGTPTTVSPIHTISPTQVMVSNWPIR